MINSEEPPFYACDTLASMPEAPRHIPIIPMYGFAMTAYGLVHDITPEEAEALSVPRYAPAKLNLKEIKGDKRIDR